MSTVTKTTRPPITISIPEAAAKSEAKPEAATRTKPDLSGAARQADIAELNRRVTDRLAKLPREFAAQTAKSQAEANARIDKLEAQLETLGSTLDGLEGALRIELAPYLGTAVAEAVKESAPQHARRKGGALAIVGLLVGLGLGAGLHGPILDHAATAKTLILSQVASVQGH